MANVHVDLMKPGAAAEIARITKRNISLVMRETTVEFYRQITLSTPVDTGRARAGWNITVGAPSTVIPPEGNYSMPSIEEHGYSTIVSVSPDHVIYITNRVPYIKPLNNGSSKQQPARFVERVVARIQRAVGQIMRKLKK